MILVLTNVKSTSCSNWWGSCCKHQGSKEGRNWIVWKADMAGTTSNRSELDGPVKHGSYLPIQQHCGLIWLIEHGNKALLLCFNIFCHGHKHGQLYFELRGNSRQDSKQWIETPGRRLELESMKAIKRCSHWKTQERRWRTPNCISYPCCYGGIAPSVIHQPMYQTANLVPTKDLNRTLFEEHEFLCIEVSQFPWLIYQSIWT